MKKLIYITGAALVMLASASCEKKETVKEPQPSVEKVNMVFTASSDNGALKTTIKSDGTTAVWTSNDKLKVFTAADTDGSVCNYVSGAGTATAEFEGQCAKEGPWTAICPASSATGFSGGTITLTMPANQNYVANTFADGAMPCVAYSETNTFNFKHSFGVLKLSLKLASGKTGSVKSITVTDKGGKQLNGTFTVKPSSNTAATYSTGGTTSVTLDCGSGVALSTSTATDFWIVVPQGAFASGFDVTVTSTSTSSLILPAKISTTKANTITAGKVKEMPAQTIEFGVIPITGEATVSSTAGIPGNKVKWVQLWAGGPKFAEFNVGTKSIAEYGMYSAWDGNDVATSMWGSNWRMPTKEEFDALISNCDKEWTSKSGRNGTLFTGKGEFSGNSLFFPANGFYYSGGPFNPDDNGLYWSSTSKDKDNAYKFECHEKNTGFVYQQSKSIGCSIRAVLKE